MKQSTIAIIVCVILGMAMLSANAQNKKVYQPDMASKVSVQVNLNLISGSLNNYLYVISHGGPDGVSQSDQMSAKSASELLKTYQAVYQSVIDSVNIAFGRAYNDFYNKGNTKWAADTLKAYTALKHGKLDTVKRLHQLKRINHGN